MAAQDPSCLIWGDSGKTQTREGNAHEIDAALTAGHCKAAFTAGRPECRLRPSSRVSAWVDLGIDIRSIRAIWSVAASGHS